jgi:hypothetical protein
MTITEFKTYKNDILIAHSSDDKPGANERASQAQKARQDRLREEAAYRAQWVRDHQP